MDVPEIVDFAPARLRDQLSGMELRARGTFAAAAAERLHPFYPRYVRRTGSGSIETVRGFLDALWSQLIAGERLNNDLASAQTLALVPPEDPWVDEQPHAEDAIAALVYAFGAFDKADPQEAVWAVQCAFNTVDYHVGSVLRVDDHRMILEHPLVQAELRRQHRDLDDLTRHPLTSDLIE